MLWASRMALLMAVELGQSCTTHPLPHLVLPTMLTPYLWRLCLQQVPGSLDAQQRAALRADRV